MEQVQPTLNPYFQPHTEPTKTPRQPAEEPTFPSPSPRHSSITQQHPLLPTQPHPQPVYIRKEETTGGLKQVPTEPKASTPLPERNGRRTTRMQQQKNHADFPDPQLSPILPMTPHQQNKAALFTIPYLFISAINKDQDNIHSHTTTLDATDHHAADPGGGSPGLCNTGKSNQHL
ncbi:Hypothetical protein SMAX5B_014228 [Scophthalmus maximus]|uniref:Uncharacterized protein n=1 Tax=Scophthalmus maximus TaxID=52904 RepID=A0A2U9BH58_SCOMX|nr:Hypothetical protein SMAX5B_014228 [Scophthalmus maximus]